MDPTSKEKSTAGVNSKDLQAEDLNAQLAPIVDLIHQRLPVYQTIARESGFGIEFGEETAFNHARETVVLSVKGFLERQSRDPQQLLFTLDFDIFHELGHLRELRDDPLGYRAIIQEAERSDGLGNLYFRMYNCLMDIWVNSNTANRAPVYRSGPEFAPEVHNYYRQELFKERDFTKNPKCVQFVDFLLNLGMGLEADLKLSPEVQAVIDAGVALPGGQGKLSFSDFIDTFLRPVLDKSAAWQATIGQRKALIDQTIRPLFEQLLKIDLKEKADFQDIKGRPAPGSGLLDPAQLKNFLEWAEEKKKEQDLSPEERAAREARKQLGDIAAKSNIPQQTVDSYFETAQRMRPVTTRLFDLWQKLRRPIRHWELKPAGHAPRGIDLDVQEVIQQYHTVLNAPDQAAVMTKNEYVQKLIWRPTILKVWVVPDLSGSMDDNMPRVRDIVVAICESLIKTTYESAAAKEKLNCVSNVVGFNDDKIPLIVNTAELHLEDVLKAYDRLKADGGTADHLALEFIKEGITPAEQEKIASGEEIALLVEITDGNTSSAERARRELAELETMGVHPVGIYINGPWRPDHLPKDEHGLRTPERAPKENAGQFDQIWNCGAQPRGFHIWRAEELVDAMYQGLDKLLKEALEAQKKGLGS